MNIIRVSLWREIPNNYTGIIEYGHGIKEWFRNRRLHREDGPAVIQNDGYKEWWLDGVCVARFYEGQVIKTEKIIFSKEQHPKYPTVQVWKYIDKNGIQEQIIIPGIENHITE